MVFGYLPKRLAFLRRVDGSEPHAMLYAVGSQDCQGVAVGVAEAGRGEVTPGEAEKLERAVAR
jgi:hypothetical protein